jgi:hypothetical protein
MNTIYTAIKKFNYYTLIRTENSTYFPEDSKLSINRMRNSTRRQRQSPLLLLLFLFFKPCHAHINQLRPFVFAALRTAAEIKYSEILSINYQSITFGTP